MNYCIYPGGKPVPHWQGGWMLLQAEEYHLHDTSLSITEGCNIKGYITEGSIVKGCTIEDIPTDKLYFLKGDFVKP